MRSLWLQEALAPDVPGSEVSDALEGDQSVDVCIVGGGYTGLWTALQLKEADPSLDVALVEADVCGGGASGRNGGFVLSWWAKFAILEKLAGSAEALRLARASADAVHAIGSFCQSNGIDARYHADGHLWAATNEGQIGAWRGVLEATERHGERPFEELDPEEVARRAGSPTHLAGVFEASGAVVQPALLARGLRRVAVERGVRLFERTPMTALSGGSPPKVRTPRGTVTAGRVVLAMNAWAVAFAEIRKRIVVVGSDIVATPPIPERLAEIGWKDGLAISDSRLLVHYYRTTDDGRIAFGKGGGAIGFGRRLGVRFEGTSLRTTDVERFFRALYPALVDVPIVSSWTGPIDRSRIGLPFFGRLDGRPDVVYGVGYSGNGVGPAYIGGKILASLALGREDEWSESALVTAARKGFPPEPFRAIGGQVVRAAIARKERAEDEDRTPNPFDEALVRLAPAGLVPVKAKD